MDSPTTMMPPPPPTTPMPSPRFARGRHVPRFARNLDADQHYEDVNLPAQNEPSERTEETPNADNLNAPLIDRAQPEKTNATGLPRVSTGLCSVCGKSFKLSNLGGSPL
ncbi:hypothetical protein ACOME3_010633 [Neoechinorhynchus agilis]